MTETNINPPIPNPEIKIAPKTDMVRAKVTWVKDFVSGKSGGTKNKKPLIIAGVAFVIILLLLVLSLLVKGNRDQAGQQGAQETPRPSTAASPDPNTTQGQLKSLEARVRTFDIEDRPLFPPELQFDIEF